MSALYKLHGHEPVPCSLLDYAAALEDVKSRIVAQDHVGDVLVSTVFLGIDHQWGDGPPLLFETIVFGGPHDQAQERYSTWEEAEKGHAAMLAKVRA